MSPSDRERVEARLMQAVERLSLADPRPPYRERLKWLRERDAAAFDRAVEHYTREVLPALAGDDPVRAWLAYGAALAGLTGPAKLNVIDARGRAHETTAAEVSVDSAMLALFIPDDTGQPVLTGLAPAEPSAAQAATLRLLTP